jgi:hypothetical protein
LAILSFLSFTEIGIISPGIECRISFPLFPEFSPDDPKDWKTDAGTVPDISAESRMKFFLFNLKD